MKHVSIGIIALLAIILISGCVQQPIPVTTTTTPSLIEPSDMVQTSYVEIEATITSLELDEDNEDCTAPAVCPRDQATIKINSIDRTNDPNNRIDLNVGDELNVFFTFSARPIKLRNDIEPTCNEGWVLESDMCYPEGADLSDPGTVVSSPIYPPMPTEMEDGYIVYHLPQGGGQVSEAVLPGVEQGSKISVTTWSAEFEINIYELVS